MSYFKAKVHQIRFRLGLRLRPRTRWGADSAPQTLSLDLRCPTSKGTGGSGRERGKKGGGREEEKEGRGRGASWLLGDGRPWEGGGEKGEGRGGKKEKWEDPPMSEVR